MVHKAESWETMFTNVVVFPHRASISEGDVKTAPDWLKKLPSCARLAVFGSYSGHPKLINPLAGLRANVTHADWRNLDRAASVGVAGNGLVVMLKLPNTRGSSEACQARRSGLGEMFRKIAWFENRFSLRT